MRFRNWMKACVAMVLALTALTAGIGATTTTASGAPVADATTAPAPWYPTSGALFNIPRSTPQNENRLEDAVVAAINHARWGSTIQMVMFSFDRDRVADALLRVHQQRKVNVQVIVNGHETPHAQVLLRNGLGGDRTKSSFFYQCLSSCRGQGDVQHTKFILFSRTGDATYVSMFGSLNMKLNGVKNQFNDLLTVNGNPQIYSFLQSIYRQMAVDKPAKQQYVVKSIGTQYRFWMLPFPKYPLATAATKYTASRDPIIKILGPVACTGANTNTGRTIIRVNMHAWDGQRGAMLANKFRSLFAAGCDVKLMVGFAGANVRKIFATRTKRGYVPIRSTGYDTNGDQEIDLYSHEKVLLINGHYGTAHGRKAVITGSSNYQNGGQYGDEMIVRLFNNKIYRQYADNWGWVNAYHTHGFNFGYTAPAADGRMAPQPILTDGLGIDSPEWRDE